MKRIVNIVLFLCVVLSLGGYAWALPTAGTQIYMDNDWTSPYTMIDGDQVYSSFCLESQNYFTPKNYYYVVSVGDYATGGGGGAESDGNGGTRDLVSQESKWLYAAYMTGIFNELGNSAAATVQSAIWWLEQEDGGIEGAWNSLSKYADNDFNTYGWDIVAVNLSLYQNGSVDNQSQLIGAAPVPEPATMLLLGTGLIGLAGLGRKKLIKN